MNPQDFTVNLPSCRRKAGIDEHAHLQWLSAKIKRSSAWKWELDLALTMLAVLACAIVLLHRGPPLAGLWIFLLSPAVLWYVWKRRQITEAWRVMEVGRPEIFLASALENLRAEIRLSTMALISTALFLAALGVIGATSIGLDQVPAWISGSLARAPLKAVFALVALGIFIYFVRDNLSMRGRARRLQAMLHEWHKRERP